MSRSASAAAVLLSLLATTTASARDPHHGWDRPRERPGSVAAGDVTHDSVVLWLKAEAKGPFTFLVAGRPAAGRPVLKVAHGRITDPLVPGKLLVRGLAPDTSYSYLAVTPGGPSLAGTFRTPATGRRAGLRFGVSGDWRGELAPYPSVGNAPGRALDFWISLGDTIYADYPSPDLPLPQALTLGDYRVKHREVYSKRYGLNTLEDLRRSTAVFATIDDHEVTNDFAGGAPPSSDPRFDPSGAYLNETQLYRDGLQAFQEYNPIRAETWGDTGDPRTAGKPKLYRARTFGRDAAVFLLDARSFRDQELAAANPFDPVSVGTFLAASFDPSRTMLGRAQVAALKADLLAAKDAVTWKIVVVPEPIQNLGVVGAPDRFEGYAAERTELLDFVQSNGIRNVLWVSADIHGTLVNDLGYQLGPFRAQVPTRQLEVVTGAVAFDAPFGPTVVELAAGLGLLSPAQVAFYGSLPVANDGDTVPNDRDDFIQLLVNQQITPLGYTPVGLAGSGIAATLVSGDYLATHTYGWTEFEIDRDTQRLRVVTWGIPPYTQAELDADPAGVTARTPAVVSEFTVGPE